LAARPWLAWAWLSGWAPHSPRIKHALGYAIEHDRFSFTVESKVFVIVLFGMTPTLIPMAELSRVIQTSHLCHFWSIQTP
jgi:hypothetical protein